MFLSQHGLCGIIFCDFFGQNTCLFGFLQSVSNKVKLLFQEKIFKYFQLTHFHRFCCLSLINHNEELGRSRDISSFWKEKGEFVREEGPKEKKKTKTKTKQTAQEERRCRPAKGNYEKKETGTRR